MRASLIRLVRLAGLAIALACAFFVAWRWYAGHAGAGTVAIDLPHTAGAAAIHALCGIPLSLGWLASLRLAGERCMPAEAALIGYLSTQIAKYLPGGVFHFLARHAHGRGFGATHGRLTAASVVETLSLLVAASLVTLVFGDSLAEQAPPWARHVRYAPLAVTAGGVALWLAARSRSPGAYLRVPRPGWLTAALASHLGFFVVSALACGVLAPSDVAFSTLLPAVSAAWLAGYLVIGAPGGLGVREAVLVVLLNPSLGETGALGVAISFRLATISGDAIMAACAALLRVRSASPSSP